MADLHSFLSVEQLRIILEKTDATCHVETVVIGTRVMWVIYLLRENDPTKHYLCVTRSVERRAFKSLSAVYNFFEENIPTQKGFYVPILERDIED